MRRTCRFAMFASIVWPPAIRSSTYAKISDHPDSGIKIDVQPINTVPEEQGLTSRSFAHLRPILRAG